MGRYSRYSLDIPLELHKGSEYFDTYDRGYISYREGYAPRCEKPLDFELHLALCILAREHLPPELLEPLKQWARENKTVLSKV